MLHEDMVKLLLLPPIRTKDLCHMTNWTRAPRFNIWIHLSQGWLDPACSQEISSNVSTLTPEGKSVKPLKASFFTPANTSVMTCSPSQLHSAMLIVLAQHQRKGSSNWKTSYTPAQPFQEQGANRGALPSNLIWN